MQNKTNINKILSVKMNIELPKNKHKKKISSKVSQAVNSAGSITLHEVTEEELNREKRVEAKSSNFGRINQAQAASPKRNK